VKPDQLQYVFFIIDDQDALFGHSGLSLLGLIQISDILAADQFICFKLAHR
jgi:hypothetical protein